MARRRPWSVTLARGAIQGARNGISKFSKFTRAPSRGVGSIGGAGLAGAVMAGAAAMRRRTFAPRGTRGYGTIQKDVKTVYKYRRAPKGLRRKWKRSRKTWTANALKNLSSRKYHYHGNQTWNTGVGGQDFFGWTTYGIYGKGGVDGSGDVQDIQVRLANETSSDPGQQTGGTFSRRYYFDSMKGRAVLTNVGTKGIFWEVYDCVARRDVPLSEGTTLPEFLTYCQDQSMQAHLIGTAGAANAVTQTGAVAAPNRQFGGVTPFQFRHFCQAFKITKVTRLQAAPSNSVSFDFGTPKNMTIEYDEMNTLLFKKGMSMVTLVRQWGQCDIESGSPDNSPSTCVMEVERDYNVKLLERNLAELNYIEYTNG